MTDRGHCNVSPAGLGEGTTITAIAVPRDEMGIDRVVWDMRYPGARQIPRPAQMVPEEYELMPAPVAPPGQYTARLTVGGQSWERPFRIARDPRLTGSDADLQAQFGLMMKIRDRTTAIIAAVKQLRAFRAQLSSEQRTPQMLGSLHAIEGSLTRIEGATPDMLPPKGLDNRLAALARTVQEADDRPTASMYQVFDDLSQLVDHQLPLIHNLMQK